MTTITSLSAYKNAWPLGRGPDLVLQIGVSFFPDLDFYRSLNPKRICIVDPDPEIQTELRTNEGIDTISVMPGIETRETILHRYNFSRFNSFVPVASEISGFPGLRSTGSVIVCQQAIGDWMNDFEIDPSEVNWLFLHHPGLESELIRLLEEVGALEWFSRIFLSTGKSAYHEGAKDPSDILEELTMLGFQPEGSFEDVDPEWPRNQLIRNNAVRESEKRLNSLQIELLKIQESVSSRVEKFESRMEKLEAENQALSEQLKHRDQQVVDYQAKEEKLRNDLSVALKLQALRDADLKDLRGKFTEYRNLSRQQAELLSTLRHRLLSASEFLKLANEDDALTQSDLADTLVRALEGDSDLP